MKKRTLVNFILDKSGSMSDVREKTISSFNEYLTTLQNDEKSNYDFSLTLFESGVQVFPRTDIKEVKKLNSESYRPDGSTALYDAVVTTLKTTKIEPGQKVITVILTDGEENASTQYTERDMRLLIETLTNQGNNTFVYLGANQDSFAKAQKFGIPQMNVANFYASNAGVGATMRTMASNTSFVAQSAGSSTSNFFSKEDQDLLGNTK